MYLFAHTAVLMTFLPQNHLQYASSESFKPLRKATVSIRFLPGNCSDKICTNPSNVATEILFLLSVKILPFG